MKRPIIFILVSYGVLIIFLFSISGCGAFTSTTVCEDKFGFDKEICLEEVKNKQNIFIDRRVRMLQ